MMEQNNAQHPYRDTPTSSSDSASDVSTIKPLARDAPSQPEPYRDDPPLAPRTTYPEAAPSHSTATHIRAPSLPPSYSPPLPCTPHTDSGPETPYTDDDEDVPLALFLQPLGAPPPYAVAVRTPYRNSLIQYVPSRTADEEELEILDDVRFSVERLMAMFIVAMLLLVIAGMFAWLAVGSGMF